MEGHPAAETPECRGLAFPTLLFHPEGRAQEPCVSTDSRQALPHPRARVCGISWGSGVCVALLS